MSYEFERALVWQRTPFEEAVSSSGEFLGRMQNAAQRAVDQSKEIASKAWERRRTLGLALEYVWDNKGVIARKAARTAAENAPATLAGAGTRIAIKAGLEVFGAATMPATATAVALGSAVAKGARETTYYRRVGTKKFFLERSHVADAPETKTGILGGLKKAFAFASHGIESEVVRRSFNTRGRAEKVTTLETKELGRERYLDLASQKGNREIEERAAMLVAKDMVDASMAHLIASNEADKQRAVEVYFRLRETLRTFSSEVQAAVWQMTKGARKDAIRKSILGESAVQLVKAPIRFFSGAAIGEKIGNKLGWFKIEPPSAQEAALMVVERVEKKAENAAEAVVSDSLVMDNEVVLPAMVEPSVIPAAAIVSKKVPGLASYAFSPEMAQSQSPLAFLRVRSMVELAGISQQYPDVAAILDQPVKIMTGGDGKIAISVGDALMSLSAEKQAQVLQNLNLVTLVNDPAAKADLVATAKEALAPKEVSFEVGKGGVSTLWHALETGGIDPLQAGSAESFMKNVLPKLKISEETRLALREAYKIGNPSTFAQFVDENSELFKARGLGNVWNGEQIAIISRPKIEAGSFQQAVPSEGKTAMLANDLFRDQPDLSPHFTPLSDDPAPEPTKTEWVRVIKNGRPQLVQRTIPPEPSAVLTPRPAEATLEVPARTEAVVPDAPSSAGAETIQYETQWVKVIEKGRPVLKQVQVPIVKATVPVEIREGLIPRVPAAVPVPEAPVTVATPSAVPDGQRLYEDDGLTRPTPAGPVEAPKPVIVETPVVEADKVGKIDFKVSEQSKITILPNDSAKAFIESEISQQSAVSRIDKGLKDGVAKARSFLTKAWRLGEGKPADDEVFYGQGKTGGHWAQIHAGYTTAGGSDNMQPGEQWRLAIEGGWYDYVRLGPAQIQQNLQEMIDSRLQITLTQNGVAESFELVGARTLSSSEAQSGLIDGVRWQEVDGGPDTITFIFCGWSHSEAVQGLYAWEDYLSQFDSKVKDAFTVIKNPRTNPQALKEAMDRIINVWSKDKSTAAELNKFRWAYDQYGWTRAMDDLKKFEPNPWDKTRYRLVFKRLKK